MQSSLRQKKKKDAKLSSRIKKLAIKTQNLTFYQGMCLHKRQKSYKRNNKPKKDATNTPEAEYGSIKTEQSAVSVKMRKCISLNQ